MLAFSNSARGEWVWSYPDPDAEEGEGDGEGGGSKGGEGSGTENDDSFSLALHDEVRFRVRTLEFTQVGLVKQVNGTEEGVVPPPPYNSPSHVLHISSWW